VIGKHNNPAVVSTVFSANMFNGMIDELTIRNDSLSPQEIQAKYQNYLNKLPGGVLPVPDLSFKRSLYDGDRDRPQYHLIPPGPWMNEPHAPIKFNGKYHIFYQFNPRTILAPNSLGSLGEYGYATLAGYAHSAFS
jgi:hypothetical protein